jgi:hypothetical protein
MIRLLVTGMSCQCNHHSDVTVTVTSLASQGSSQMRKKWELEPEWGGSQSLFSDEGSYYQQNVTRKTTRTGETDREDAPGAEQVPVSGTDDERGRCRA